MSGHITFVSSTSQRILRKKRAKPATQPSRRGSVKRMRDAGNPPQLQVSNWRTKRPTDGDRQTASFHSVSSNNQMSLSVGAVATTRRHRPNLHFVTGMSRRCSRPGPFVFPSSSRTHSQVECFEEKNAI